MKKKSLNEYVALYHEELLKGKIRVAYEKLLKYMITLRGHFSRAFPVGYVFGNVSPGYMDYSYFPFYNEFLRSKKLRFGIVLNHEKMCFELWLMGQNEELQKKYWELLKSTKWNKGRIERPRYSVLEVVLVEKPDFDDLKVLSVAVEKEAERIVPEILDCLLGLE